MAEIPSEKLVTIAQNIPKVYEAGQLSVWNASESLQGSASGTAVSVNDVSPIEHKVDCTLKGKNLLNPNDYVDSHLVTIEDNGTIHLGSEGPEGSAAYVKYNMTLEGGDYVISSVMSGYEEYIQVYLDSTLIYNKSVNFDGTQETLYCAFTANENAELKINLYARDNVTSGTAKLQLEKGTTPTPYTPYIDDFSTVIVEQYEGNLIDDTIKTRSGNNIFFNNKNIWSSYKILPPGTYVLSAKVKDGLTGYIRVLDFENNNKNLFSTTTNRTLKFVLTETKKCNFKVESSSFTSENDLEWAKLEVGTTATPYEPYIKPTTYTANADGTVEDVTSISPNMTLISNNDGAVISAHYFRDPDLVISNLQQEISLSGGEE